MYPMSDSTAQKLIELSEQRIRAFIDQYQRAMRLLNKSLRNRIIEKIR